MAKKAMGPAFHRLYENVFICLKCNAKIKADPLKVKKKLIKCRKCNCYKLRPKAKEPRGAAKSATTA